MALRDRNTCDTNNTPRSMERGDGLTASMMNKLANSILRLVTGDGKTIAVNYVGGKAVISSAQRQIIPIGGGSIGDGDSVIVASTKAGLSSPSATAYFTRGWVTGEAGTNYGPWVWDGTNWRISPITYSTQHANARPGDFAIVSGRGDMKIASGDWEPISHTY